MRKTLLALLTCTTILALTACGSSSSSTKKSDSKSKSNTKVEKETEEETEEEKEEFKYIWYDVEFPEDFEQSESEDSKFYSTTDSNKVIKVYVNSNTFENAQQDMQKSIEFWKGEHTDEGTMEAAGLTWYVEKFTWNDDLPSYTYYADVDENSHLEIDMFCIDKDDEITKTFFDTFKTVETDNLYDTSYELKDAANAETSESDEAAE